MAQAASLYELVVDITEEYLGPPSRRFINRQIQNHLSKEPEELAGSDLKNLVKWIRITAAYLTDDTKLINEYCSRLLKVGDVS